MIHAASQRRGPIEVAVLTLTRQAQFYAAMLLTPVDMYSSGAMRGAKMWRWAMYSSNSRSLMVKNPWGFLSVGMRSHVQKVSHCFHAVLSLCSREVERRSVTDL